MPDEESWWSFRWRFWDDVFQRRPPVIVWILGTAPVVYGFAYANFPPWLQAEIGLPWYVWICYYAIVLAIHFETGAAARVRTLEGDLRCERDKRADLEISHERTFPMWWPQQRWLRVRVRNKSKMARAVDVKLKLIDMMPCPLSLNVLPGLLGRKDHELSSAEPCCINPEDDEFFDVAGVNHDHPENLRLWTAVAWGQSFAMKSDQHHECVLTLRVTAENADTKEARFILRRIPGTEPELVKA